MADISVGSVDTNERQYNIPLRAEVVQWVWVCTIYPKSNRQSPHVFISEWAADARENARRKALNGRYSEWDLKQVMVPIAV